MKVYEGRVVYKLVSEGQNIVLDTPDKVTGYLRDAFNQYPLQEQFIVIPLDRRLKPFAHFRISLGIGHATLVNPSETYRPAILVGAASVVVAHNHPSGDPAPSQADMRVTTILKQAGEHLQLSLLDHIIIGEKKADPAGQGYYSFQEAGLL